MRSPNTKPASSAVAMAANSAPRASHFRAPIGAVLADRPADALACVTARVSGRTDSSSASEGTTAMIERAGMDLGAEAAGD